MAECPVIRILRFAKLVRNAYQVRRSRVPPPYCGKWCTSLALLLRSGLPLREALLVLSVDGEKQIQLLVNTSLHAVDTGIPMSQALFEHVPPLLSRLLQLAEVTGDLPSRLNRYAVQIEQKRVWKDKLLKTLSYPAILMVMAVALLFFVSFHILPMFIQMDMQFGTHVDATSMVIEHGLGMAPYGFLLVVAILVICCTNMYFRLVQSGIHRPTAKRYVLSWEWLLAIQTSQISGQLGVLLESGVPIIEALQQLNKSSQRSWQKAMYQKILMKLEQGASLSSALERYLTVSATYLLRIAEETGEMGDTLLRIEEYAHHRLQSLMEHVLRWLEPMLLVFMGLIVLLTMYAVFMPMYDFVSTLQPK